MKTLTTFLVVCFVSCICIAQDKKPPADVPDSAKWEVLRRGNMVQDISGDGAIENSAEQMLSEAIATPVDDSHKWYLTLITTDACPPCDALKKAFEESKELYAWREGSHFQIRDAGDPTQQEWIKGVRKSLERGKFPALVIQPPRNGKYGQNKVVVAVLHGYDTANKNPPSAYSDRMRKAIMFYLDNRVRDTETPDTPDNQPPNRRELSAPVPSHNGASQRPGGQPPFKLTPAPTPPDEGGNDWPPKLNEKPSLTPVQMKQLTPDADDMFIAKHVISGTKDVNLYVTDWAIEKQRRELDLRLAELKKHEEELANPTEPPTQEVTGDDTAVITAIMVTLALCAGVAGAGYLLMMKGRSQTQASTSPIQLGPLMNPPTKLPLGGVSLDELLTAIAQRKQQEKPSSNE